MEDMRKYQAIIRPALIGEFAGFKVITSGLPTWYGSQLQQQLVTHATSLVGP